MEIIPVNHNVRRASIGISLVVVLGTYYGLKTDSAPGLILMVSCLSWFAALFAILYSSLRPELEIISWIAIACILFCICCTAFLSASLSSLRLNGLSDYDFSPLDGDRIEVTGIVNGDADVLPSLRPHRTVVQYYLLIEQAKIGIQLLPVATQRIRVICYGGDIVDIPRYGEQWQVSGRVTIDKRKGKAGTGRKNVCLKASEFDTKYLSDGNGWWLAKRCYAARRASSLLLSVGINDYPVTSDILQSLLLGYRRLSYEMRQLFVFTGTLHIFAISGSHVVVMGAILIVILGMFRVSSVYWGLFLAPLLCMYTFATGMQSSAVRACIMAIIYWGAPLLGRKADSLTALFVSALLIVAAEPTQLLDTGFILSVVCVFGLIVLFPIIHAPGQKILEPDPLRLQMETKVVTVLRYGGKGLWSMVAMSISAWLVSAPLTAYYFGNFTPIGLLANLIVIPVSAMVILSGCLSLVLGSCIEWFAVIFNHANIALIWLMVKPMDLLSKVPHGNIKFETVPLWSLFLWYGLLAGWVFWHKYWKMVLTMKNNDGVKANR